ncbi:MAG: hypothetical protein Q4D27_08590 [Coriobacteriia bacterium]|nr:hypothetical protein [Coriobacteriia bacterium]
MTDKEMKEMKDAAAADGIELSDELLDSIAGGYVYHDEGDPAAHRREAFYVLDDKGEIVMRFDDVSKAKHWANNLRTSQNLITTEQFEQLRKNHTL